MHTRLQLLIAGLSFAAGAALAAFAAYPLACWDAAEASVAGIGEAWPVQNETDTCWRRRIVLAYADRDGVARRISTEESVRTTDAPALPHSLLVDPCDGARAWRRSDLLAVLGLGGLLAALGASAAWRHVPGKAKERRAALEPALA